MNNKQFMESIKGIDPKYAKYLAKKNTLVEQFAEQIGVIQWLDQPMCTKCEMPALWNKGATAYCPECGGYIKKPWTMREYLVDQLGNKMTPEQLEQLDFKGKVK